MMALMIEQPSARSTMATALRHLELGVCGRQTIVQL